jgi:hypothetical protein
MPLRIVLLALLMALSIASSGNADIILRATLTNSQEVPLPVLTTSAGDPRPVSFGTATFVLNDTMTAMTLNATVFDIDFTGLQTLDPNDNLTNAHIHAPAPPGERASVVWGFIGMPLNDTMPPDTVVTPFLTGVGGTVQSKWDRPEGNNGTTLTEQLPNILAGLSYINFHTVQNGAGEVRGQITVAVPEPSTLTLLGFAMVGLAGIGLVRSRRQKGDAQA